MPMPKYLRNLDGTAGKPRLSEGTMLSEGPVNDCTTSTRVLFCARDATGCRLSDCAHDVPVRRVAGRMAASHTEIADSRRQPEKGAMSARRVCRSRAAAAH